MTAETPTAELPVTGEERQARVTWRDVARALVREPVVLLAVIFLALLVIAAVFAPWLAPYDPLLPNIFSGRLAPLSTAQGPGGVDQFHVLGTDALGRDDLLGLQLRRKLFAIHPGDDDWLLIEAWK